jgi:diadenosine tetraphosphate (Ap4A) HIT family hydrolase
MTIQDASGCLACDVTSRRITPPGGKIYEEGGWLLEHAISPVPLKGFLILKPKRHVEHLAALNQDEALTLGPLIEKVSNAMMKALQPERVYLCSFGEVVKHVHLYFVPRYASMPPGGPDILSRMGSRKSPWTCDDETAADAASLVRTELLKEPGTGPSP